MGARRILSSTINPSNPLATIPKVNKGLESETQFEAEDDVHSACKGLVALCDTDSELRNKSIVPGCAWP